MNSDNRIIDLFNSIEIYYVLLVTIVGVVGNSISFLMFIFSKLRLEKTNLALSLLALVDNGFLISMFFVTFRHFTLNFFDKSNIACKITIYFHYVFSFLSGWLVVSFSIERLVAVYFPLKRFIICDSKTNYCAIISLILFSLTFYSFSLFSSGVETDPRSLSSSAETRTSCVTLANWFDFVRVLSVIDILLTIAIPFVIITVANLLIVYKLMKSTQPKDNNMRRIQTSYKASSGESSRSFSFSHNRSISRCSEVNGKKRRKIKFQKNNVNRSFDDGPESSNNVKPKQSTLKTKFRTCRSAHSLNTQDERLSRKLSATSESLSEIVHMQFSVLNRPIANHILRKSVQLKRYKAYSETTKTLLVISIMFLILHLPIGLNKLWYFVREYFVVTVVVIAKTEKPLHTWIINHSNFTNERNLSLLYASESGLSSSELQQMNTSEFEEIFERISCYIYYFNFSLNFFLYTYNKAKFRQTFLNFLKRIFRVKKSKKNDKYY